ncbi:MAG: LytR family transcriptional regulator [Jatrophihabitans sp.]|nr:MAG: LytR family transcriptional regulator [Jatrophihabitans sp.]
MSGATAGSGNGPTMPSARHRAGKAPGQVLVWSRRFGALVATVVSMTLLVGFGYGWYNYHTLDQNLHRLQIVTKPITKQVASATSGSDMNILIAGNDDRTNETPAELAQLHTGSDGGSMATDTMMIVHVPANGADATLISLPRDAYVAIPGFQENKLNSAYADGYTYSSGTPDQRRAAGASLLIQTVENLTGLAINHFVMVNLLGFYRISNAIGGVTVNLCHAVDDHYSGFVESAGVHVLQGLTALEFVRQRHGLTNGDIDRTARQRYFLTAAFRKIASAGVLLNPGRLGSLIKAVDSSLYVDSGFDLLSFAKQMSNLNANNIHGQAIPFVRYDTVANVGSVEIVDPGQVRQFMANVLGQGQAVLGTVAPAAPSSVTVQVLNGGTQDGAAQHNAQLLRGYGFTASYTSAAGSSAATTVEYAAGMQAQVKALLKYLPPTVVLQQSDVPTPTLVLGQDGLGVNPPAAPSPSASVTPTATAPAPKPIDASCIN